MIKDILGLVPPSVWNAVQSSIHVRAAVCSAIRIFEGKQVPEPRESAEYLAIKAFGAIESRREARTSHLTPTRRELDRFVSLCEKRERLRTPIQYLVGDWDFCDITLMVRSPVLIPRPETEELVQHLLKDLPSTESRILDVGCGSGAILLAALHARSKWTGIGIDIEREAVKLSRENARLLRLEDRANILEGRIEDLNGRNHFDALISNPPYIPKKDMDSLEREVRDHEDYKALCGGEDGLDVVRDIMKYVPRLVKPGGSVWLEVDSSHPTVLGSLIFHNVEFVKKYDDIYGHPRFCHFIVK